MKLTKSKLKQIIKEEIAHGYNYTWSAPPDEFSSVYQTPPRRNLKDVGAAADIAYSGEGTRQEQVDAFNQYELAAYIAGEGDTKKGHDMLSAYTQHEEDEMTLPIGHRGERARQTAYAPEIMQAHGLGPSDTDPEIGSYAGYEGLGPVGSPDWQNFVDDWRLQHGLGITDIPESVWGDTHEKMIDLYRPKHGALKESKLKQIVKEELMKMLNENN